MEAGGPANTHHKTVFVDLRPTATIQTLKEVIVDAIGVPANIDNCEVRHQGGTIFSHSYKIYSGIVLSCLRTILQSRLDKNSLVSLKYDPRPNKKILYILTPEEKMVRLEVEDGIRVQRLKRKISAQLNVEATNLEIRYQGRFFLSISLNLF